MEESKEREQRDNFPNRLEFTSANVNNNNLDVARDYGGYEYVRDQRQLYNYPQSSLDGQHDSNLCLEAKANVPANYDAEHGEGHVAEPHTCELTVTDNQMSVYQRFDDKLTWKEELQVKLQLNKAYVKYFAGILVCLVIILFFTVLFVFSNIKFF